MVVLLLMDNQDWGSMELGTTPANDGDHTMMHMMEIKCKKDHIISRYPFM